MAQPIRPLPATAELLKTRPVPPPEPGPLTTPEIAAILATPPAPEHDLEACAGEVLKMLPTHIQDYIKEIAYVHNRQPLWSLVAGHCLKAYENGDAQAPLLDPSWPRRFPSLDADPAKKTYVCEWQDGEKGRHEFKPSRYKQRFCSTECGVAAAMATKLLLASTAQPVST
jgi:hypothetical protein